MHTSCVQQGGASDVGTNRGGGESGLHAGSLSDIRGRPRHADSSVSVFQESISVAALERPRLDDESGSLTQEDSQEMFR